VRDLAKVWTVVGHASTLAWAIGVVMSAATFIAGVLSGLPPPLVVFLGLPVAAAVGLATVMGLTLYQQYARAEPSVLRAPSPAARPLDVATLRRLASEADQLAAKLHQTTPAVFQQRVEIRRRLEVWRDELAACLPEAAWIAIAPVPDWTKCGEYFAERRAVLDQALSLMGELATPPPIVAAVENPARPEAPRLIVYEARIEVVGQFIDDKVAGVGVLLTNTPFAQAVIRNEPSHPVASAIARDVRAHVEFWRNKLPVLAVQGRWADMLNPVWPRPTLTVDFGIGEQRYLNVAVRLSDGRIFAFGERSLLGHYLAPPDYALPGLPCEVSVQLLTVGVDETHWFGLDVSAEAGMTLRYVRKQPFRVIRRD
jgi:hypothetical protein